MTSSDPVVRHGLVRIEHELEVPVDRRRRDGPTTRVFAREVHPVGVDRTKLPALLFLQGGPGGLAPRPRGRDGWLGRALERFRVVLLDQRGVGRSEPIDVQAPWGDAGAPLGDDALAERLACYRADAIVADAEALRRGLLGEDGRWTLLGQSYGGFVAMTYLSFAPEALEAVLITGGVPSLDRPAVDVYRATIQVLLGKLRAFSARYPGDVARWRDLHAAAAEGLLVLADGRRLTPLQVGQIGHLLGTSTGPDELHELLELVWAGDGTRRTLSTRARQRFLEVLPFGASPIYAALHEPIYAQAEAPGWAAARALAEARAEGWPADLPDATAEMVLPDLFDEVPDLRPLRGVAERLARKADWPRLYDPEALARNRVPVAALAYAEDLYVPLAFSQETAARVPRMRLWVTNEYEHDGLRAQGDRILPRLLEQLVA